MFRVLLCVVIAIGCRDNPYRGGTRFELALEGSATSRQLDHLAWCTRERLDEKGLTLDVARQGDRVIVRVPPIDAEILGHMREILPRSLSTELRFTERGEVIAGRDVVDADFTYEAGEQPIVNVTLAKLPQGGGDVAIVADGRVRHTAFARMTKTGITLTLEGSEADLRSIELENLLRNGLLPPINYVDERKID